MSVWSTIFRAGVTDPDDLANETLLTVWMRSDYIFERKEDFLRVCYGFADKIRRQGYRQARKEFLKPSNATMESLNGNIRGTTRTGDPRFFEGSAADHREPSARKREAVH